MSDRDQHPGHAIRLSGDYKDEYIHCYLTLFSDTLYIMYLHNVNILLFAIGIDCDRYSLSSATKQKTWNTDLQFMLYNIQIGPKRKINILKYLFD